MPSMVEKAKRTMETAIQRAAPSPSTVRKARMVSAPPSTGFPAASTAPSTPEQQMARPVTVQITRVSKNAPVMLM